MLVFSVAVFWGVKQRFLQRNGCSQPNNIPFKKLANHRFRSIFKNVFASNNNNYNTTTTTTTTTTTNNNNNNNNNKNNNDNDNDNNNKLPCPIFT